MHIGEPEENCGLQELVEGPLWREQDDTHAHKGAWGELWLAGVSRGSAVKGARCSLIHIGEPEENCGLQELVEGPLWREQDDTHAHKGAWRELWLAGVSRGSAVKGARRSLIHIREPEENCGLQELVEGPLWREQDVHSFT